MPPEQAPEIKRPKVLYVTRLNQGSTGFGYLEGFRRLGLTVKEIDTSKWLGGWTRSFREKVVNKLRGGRLPKNVLDGFNHAIAAAADEFEPDLTFFVGAPFIYPETLRHTRCYGMNFVHFQDDMFNPACRTYTFSGSLPHWDCVFITRKCNVEEFKAWGVPNVVFVRKAYTPGLYRPVQPTMEEYDQYQGDVVFIGSFNSPARADYLAEIVDRLPGVKFNIWGGGWGLMNRPQYWFKPRRWKTWPVLKKATHDSSLYYDEMSKAMNSHKITLGFLNHYNRDLHTSRTLEIPACGAFMLMERTTEQQEMFAEGIEAEYFDSVDEAVSKIQYYLAHDEERQKIALAGNRRLLASDYSYFDRAKTALEQYQRLAQESGR